MSKGLKTLIRLHKFNVDEKRRVLGALQAREEQILAAIEHNEQTMLAEQKVASDDAAGVGFAYASFHQGYLQRRAALHGQLNAIREQIQAAREELAEAFNTLKTYEITQANRERREQEELDRKEQAFLDEIGLNMHRRKEE
jgi:flagellar export protein FliJ